MAVLVIAALLVITNIISMPSEEFSKTEKTAGLGDIACPTEGATPLPADTIHVQVLNATSQSGLASSVTTMLAEQGFVMQDPANAASELTGTVEIDVSPKNIDAAYTVARFFPDARVVLSEGTDEVVQVVLGTFFDSLLPKDDIEKIAGAQSALKGSDSCLPVDPELLAPATTQTGDDDQSGEGSQSEGQSE